MDTLTATIKVGADVDVKVAATCADATSAAELSGGLKTAIGSARLALTQGGAKPAQELLDLIDITPKVDGSSVTIQKTIKVAGMAAAK